MHNCEYTHASLDHIMQFTGQNARAHSRVTSKQHKLISIAKHIVWYENKCLSSAKALLIQIKLNVRAPTGQWLDHYDADAPKYVWPEQ
jgi:uncharacterized protein YcfL